MPEKIFIGELATDYILILIYLAGFIVLVFAIATTAQFAIKGFLKINEKLDEYKKAP